MIKIFPDNTTSREQPPRFLRGLKQESLIDLSWTDPALGVQDLAWWPEEKQYPEYDPETQKLGDEILTLGDQVVIVSYPVIDLTQEEIDARLKATITFDVLTVDTWTIPADAATPATITYTSEETVYFSVNEQSHAVDPIDYVATLEITANATGPIQVEVKDKQLIITAVEVQL